MTAPAKTVRMLPVAEVANRLCCSRQHVYDLIAAGRLESTDISASHSRAKTRIPESELDRFLQRRTRRRTR